MEYPPVDGATYTLTYEKDGYVTQVIENADLSQPQSVNLVTESVTAISDISCASVKSVKYINAMGQTSYKPFKGVNIVVTELNNGTTTTTKIVK